MTRPIIGLDSGARRLAIYHLEADYFTHIEVPPTTVEDEIFHLKWWLENELGTDMAYDVWMETTVVGVRGGTQNAIRHSMTIGAVLATVGGTLISPTTWKASVLGHGSGDSIAYTEWVEASCPEITEAVRGITTRKQQRQDCYAAYCIAQHGHLARRHPDQLGQKGSLSRRARRS